MTTAQTIFEEIVDRAEMQGWTHKVTAQGHHQLLAPDGKGIVVTSGTPSDHRSIRNFAADMARHGFKPANDREELMEKRETRKRSIGVQKAVLKLMESNPETIFSVDELKIRLGGQFSGDRTVANALINLHNKGKIVKVERGTYRLTGVGLPPLPPPPKAPTQRATPDLPSQADDVQILDEALAALGRIESVVRKYKAIITQMRTAFQEMPHD